MEDCIFCRIANHEIKSEIVLENDLVTAFKDLNPVAPTHFLIIPNEHFADIYELSKSEKAAEIMEAIISAAAELKEKYGLPGYNLINNCGKAAGQSVFHLHFHMLSGFDIGKIIA